MNSINFSEFQKINMRIGTIVEVQVFKEAIKPAYKLKIDLGENIGIKQSSAQITHLYSKEELVGKQVVAVVNLKPKKIGPFISECLITGFYIDKEAVILASPDKKIENGLRLA